MNIENILVWNELEVSGGWAWIVLDVGLVLDLKKAPK